MGERCWPTSSQSLLLRAATLRGAAAEAAWRSWLRDHRVEDADEGAFRLLPAVHRSLERQSPDAPQMSYLAGLARHTWFHNQRKLRVLAAAIRALREVETPVLLLKGAALCATHPVLVKERPMRDVDLLVPPEAAELSVKTLLSHGFHADVRAVHEQLHFRHAAVFSSGDIELDLHTAPLVESLTIDKATRDWAWDSASAVEVMGEHVLVPGATEQLFHTLVHGVRYCAVPPVRWVLDSLQLLERARAHDIDWPRLVRLSKAHRSTMLVARAIDYLSAQFDASIPPDVTEELRSERPSATERIDGFFKTRRFELVGDLPSLLVGYGHRSRVDAQQPSTRDFARYLRCVWNVPPEQSLKAALRERATRRLLASWRRATGRAGRLHG